MTKTAIIVCGNKGGVGKSLAALAIVSVLERLMGNSVAVLDGDGRTPDVYRCALRKVPAQRVDFRRLQPARHDDPHDAEYEWKIKALLAGSDYLVVNTPDGADDTLLEWFRATLRPTESEGYSYKLLYLMNARGDGLELLPAMAEEFPFLIPMQNMFFNTAGAGHWSAFEPMSREFNTVLQLPVLRPYEANLLVERQLLPHEFVVDPAIPALSRQRMMDWLSKVGEELSDAILASKPNVRPASLDMI